jgi:uncharacterized repeat protein (TIGR01451 family)
MVVFGYSVGVFAADDYVSGTANFKNSTENSAKVGDILTLPEIGWNRYNNDSTKILYNGFTHFSDSDTHLYKNDHMYSSDGTIKFKFYGSKLRIIGQFHPKASSNTKISIDGKDENFNEYSSVWHEGSAIVYENLNLNNEVHTITITTTQGGERYTRLDAVDVYGTLLKYDDSISLDKTSVNVIEDDMQQLTATTTPTGAQVTWKSSDSSIATVDSTGRVTGVKEGTCTITATTPDGLTATCAVTVTPKGTEPIPTPEPTDSEKIINIAHAKGDNTNNAGGDVTIIFHGAADTTLSVIKTADVKDVWVGDNFTYTIVVTNTGTKTAKAVVVNDPAPNHIDFNVSGVTTTQGSVDSSSTSKNIKINVGDILPGGTVTIKVPATVIL